MLSAFPAGSRVPAALASCRHCGEPCADAREAVHTADGLFCCHGCRTVFAMLAAHDLGGFYQCELPPGVSQKGAAGRDPARFAALDDEAVAARLITYNDGTRARALFSIPAIHCASCVWLL